MIFQDRQYQSEAAAILPVKFDEFDRLLGIWPTGGGKTRLFSLEAKRRADLGERTLILAHRNELIDQAIDKLHAATGIVAQKEKAEFRASHDAPVVVASVQTMGRRFERWPKDHFPLIVCDEAHHSLSEQWQQPLRHFSSQVLGVTATPHRGDKKNLGAVYEAIAFEERLFDWQREDGTMRQGLVNAGYLAKIAVKSIPLSIDISNVTSEFDAISGGQDFSKQQLAMVLEPYLDEIAVAIRQYASFRRTLAFLPLIATSHKFVDACNRAGLRARHIDGESDDRADILGEFASENSSFDILSNAMLFGEGYDNPLIDCVIVLRATRSISLISQFYGRGTRLHPTKENLLLLDFLWLAGKFRVCRPAHLIARNEEEAEAITAAAGGGMALPAHVADGVESGDLQTLASGVIAQREEALRKRLEENRKRKANSMSAEEFALSHGDFALSEYEPTMAWESQAVTDGQARALKRAKIDLDTVSGKGHAEALLSRLYRDQPLKLASTSAVETMQKNGFMRGIAAQCGIFDFSHVTAAQAGQFFGKLRERKSK